MNFRDMTDEELKILENKLVKMYWTPCWSGKSSERLPDLNLVDGSDNFDCIPRNSRGYMKEFCVGELRDIIHLTVSILRES